MKNETSVENSKHLANNSSMLTAENSSKHSKFNNKRNKLTNNNQKYSNTALFENPRRDFSNTITNKRSHKALYLTDVTITKFRDTQQETKTTIESTIPNYKTHNQFLKNRNKTPRKFSKNSLPSITQLGATKYAYNPPCFTCCDNILNPEFLTHLYNEQLFNRTDNKINKNTKKPKKALKEDRTEFLRKTNEIKRIKYEMELKKEAMEEYKENIKMQKCGIEFTISNIKTYRDNLENNFLTKYNDDLRKLSRELFELKLKSDKQNNELILLKNKITSINYLLIKKGNTLRDIEKWLNLQIHIKEGIEPKNLKEALKKYNNKLIFESLDELNNTLLYKENRNLRLMEKFNKSENEKEKYVTELIEQEKEAGNIDESVDLLIIQKENHLKQLKKREETLNNTIKTLNLEKNSIKKRSKSINNKTHTHFNNQELKTNELGILYKPIQNKNDMYILIDAIYVSIISNNIKGFLIENNYQHQLNNNNISRNSKALIKMKIIELSLNYLVSSINKKINSDKNYLNIMEKTCKTIDLYHKKINGNRNRKQVQQNWDNLMKKIVDKNKKTYYLPRGKIEKYNIVSIRKKKNEEKMKNQKVIKKIDIWDFLYDTSSNDNYENKKYNEETVEK